MLARVADAGKNCLLPSSDALVSTTTLESCSVAWLAGAGKGLLARFAGAGIDSDGACMCSAGIAAGGGGSRILPMLIGAGGFGAGQTGKASSAAVFASYCCCVNQHIP